MNGYEKRTAEKKQHVIEATFSLMNSPKGVAHLTIEDITKASGVSKATIFKYFGNKENLVGEVFKDFLQRMGVGANKIMEQNLPFEDTIIAMSQNKIHFIENVDHQFFIDLMAFVTTKKDDDLSSLMEQYTKQSLNMMLDIFHRGRKEGKVALKYSDEFLLLYFESIIAGMTDPRIYSRLQPYTAEWTEMVLKGIAP